jgi:hypothetical protein
MCIFLPTIGHAHRPVFVKKDPGLVKPRKLKRPYEKSVALYSYFDNKNDLDVYEFTITEKDLKGGPVRTLVGSLVPACKPLKNLLTTWVVTGPDLSALYENPDEEIVRKINFKEGEGALIVKNEMQGELWHESHTAHYYFYQKRESLILDVPGTYRIHIWANDGARGDYVLEFGDKEMWGFTDILYTLWVSPKLLFEKEIVTKNCKTSSMKGKVSLEKIRYRINN